MNKKQFAAWNESTRKRAAAYLESQGIVSPNLGDWPAFDVAPHFGIWCVESQKGDGKIGWWVFAGDCPTDYVSEEGRCHPRAALQNLLAAWKSHIPFLNQGKQPPDVKLGDGANLIELGQLLEKRIAILEEWQQDDSLWEDR